MERAAPFRGVHAGGAQGEQTRLMPPPRWAARGFGVLMEHLPPGPGPVLPPFQPPPTAAAASPVPSGVSRASPSPRGHGARDREAVQRRIETWCPTAGLYISTETVTVRALATGTWPAGIHVGAPTRVARCRVESSSPPSGAMAQRTWVGGAAWLFRAFLAHPSSTAHWCGPRGDL